MSDDLGPGARLDLALIEMKVGAHVALDALQLVLLRIDAIAARLADERRFADARELADLIEEALALLRPLIWEEPPDACNCHSRAFKDPMQHAPSCPVRRPR